MSTRLQRDKQTGLQEKHQAILSNLLKDEDNKYCVDCEAKGPRWASWNLGVFLCIRCAGIHRNLGVHISKVKSVNLDTWTPEQISMMVEIGNYTGRKVFEAHLPENFARPRTDSALEAFIRSKYCSKKYMDKSWTAPKPRIQVASQPIDDDKKERRKIKSAKANVPLANVSRPKPAEAKPPPHSQSAPQLQQTAPPPSASEDLLGLDAPSVPVTNHTSHTSASTNDLFGDFLSGPTEPVTTVTNQSTVQDPTPTEGNLLGGPEQTKSTKDSIMALFGNQPTAQPQQYGVPGGMYMAQQPVQYGGMMGMQQGMMGQPQQPMGMMPSPMGMQGNMMGMQGMPAGMGMGGMQPQMYGMQQPQQMYMQQVQQQLAGMSLGNPNMGYPQQGTVAAGGNAIGGWNSQPAGHTMSTNLWQ